MKACAFQKTYQQKCVLSFPGFDFQPGRIYALIGANGSGKSTFARILAGIAEADHSVIPFAEKMPHIGHLPQKPYAFRMSLRKNLMLNASGKEAESHDRADLLIRQLDLDSLAEKKATTLSGGEAARMYLARLLMKDYELLILDEPCAAMDIASTLRAEQLISDYTKQNQSAVILITHSLQQARRLADEVLFFHEGHLMETGETISLLSHPIHKETQQFLDFFS